VERRNSSLLTTERQSNVNLFKVCLVLSARYSASNEATTLRRKAFPNNQLILVKPNRMFGLVETSAWMHIWYVTFKVVTLGKVLFLKDIEWVGTINTATSIFPSYFFESMITFSKVRQRIIRQYCVMSRRC